MPEFHAEPYLYLAGLTHKAALVAWGSTSGCGSRRGMDAGNS